MQNGSENVISMNLNLPKKKCFAKGQAVCMRVREVKKKSNENGKKEKNMTIERNNHQANEWWEMSRNCAHTTHHGEGMGREDERDNHKTETWGRC